MDNECEWGKKLSLSVLHQLTMPIEQLSPEDFNQPSRGLWL